MLLNTSSAIVSRVVGCFLVFQLQMSLSRWPDQEWSDPGLCPRKISLWFVPHDPQPCSSFLGCLINLADGFPFPCTRGAKQTTSFAKGSPAKPLAPTSIGKPCAHQPLLWHSSACSAYFPLFLSSALMCLKPLQFLARVWLVCYSLEICVAVLVPLSIGIYVQFQYIIRIFPGYQTGILHLGSPWCWAWLMVLIVGSAMTFSTWSCRQQNWPSLSALGQPLRTCSRVPNPW